LFAAVFPKIGELLTHTLSCTPHLNLINRHCPSLRQHIFNVSPELSKGIFSTQREILTFTISPLDLMYFLIMLNSLVKDLCDLYFFMSWILLFISDLCKQNAVIAACTPWNQTGLRTHHGEQLDFQAPHAASATAQLLTAACKP